MKTQNNPELPNSIEELNPEEIDVPKWQLAHLRKRLMEEVEEEVEDEWSEFELADEPGSKIQGLVKEVYETLRDDPNPDAFDKFYENSELDGYNRLDMFIDFIEEVIDRLETSNSDIQEINQLDREKLKTEEGIDKALKTISDAVNSDSELEAVRDIIEEDYEELISTPGEMSVEEYRATKKDFIERELIRAVKGLEPREKFQEYFEEFRALNNNDVEDVAVRLNNVVDVGVDVWETIIYSMLSPHAKDIKIDDREIRSSLHTLLIGEISTGKSKILSIVDDISPQSEKVTDMTKASFIGAYDNQEDEIQDGVVDRIVNGNLIMEEYDKIDLSDGSIMRTVFDNSGISVSKGQDTKSYSEIPTAILAGANPKKDFFIQGDNMREQIPFKEGELSRFDITVPLINTEEDTEKIIDRMEIFGGRELDLREISDMMNQLATKMGQVEEIDFEETEEGQQPLPVQLKEAFKSQQKTLENKNRQELLIARDFEILVRLVNIIGCIEEEPTDGKICISEETISKAVSQFETLIDLRDRLYTGDDRKTVSSDVKDDIEDKIFQMTGDGESVEQHRLKDRCLDEGIVNNKVTFYNKMEDLVNEERIKYVGDKENYKEVKLLAQ